MRRRGAKPPPWDPVANWDGRVVVGGWSYTPDEMTAICGEIMRRMEKNCQVNEEDAEANATPVGGMQFTNPGLDD